MTDNTEQGKWWPKGQNPPPEQVHVSSLSSDDLEPGWYAIEVSAGRDGIPEQERFWDGYSWGEVRDVSDERKAELREQDRISRENSGGWGNQRLSDDPNWDPHTSDTDGDGLTDAEELALTEERLKPKRWF